MIGKIVMLIALAVISGFIVYILFTKEKLNIAYIKYTLFVYPFLGIDLLPSLFSITIFDFITCFFFLFFYKQNVNNKSENLFYNLFFILFIFLISIGVYLSEQVTRDTGVAIFQFFTISAFIITLYQVLLSDINAKYDILKSLRYLLLFSFGFLLLQLIIGPAFSFAKSENINVAGGVAIRYPSFFQDPQKYAQFLSVLSFMVLVPSYNNKTNKQLSILLAILSICALLLTGGRAGLGGWVAGIILITILGSSKYRAQLTLVLVVLTGFAYLLKDQLSIFKRADLQSSYVFRQMIWDDAIAIYQNNPWFGIGIGNYASYVSLHNPDQFWIHNNEITFYDHPESGYLKLLVEFGFPAFAILLFIIMYILYQNIIFYFNTKLIEYILYTAAILSWLIGFYTVYSLGDIRIKMLIVLVLCLSVASTRPKNTNISVNTNIYG